jgi:hypothetical protein
MIDPPRSNIRLLSADDESTSRNRTLVAKRLIGDLACTRFICKGRPAPTLILRAAACAKMATESQRVQQGMPEYSRSGFGRKAHWPEHDSFVT